MSHEGGFTLVELLIAVVIGLLVIGTGVTFLTNATRRADDAERRADATQRARIAMDVITRDLRSQVCYRSSPTAVPIAPIIAATSTAVTFYLDFGEDAALTTQRRTLSLDPTTGTLTERVWPDPTGAGTSRVRTLATSLAGDDSGVLLRYFAFNRTTGQADTPLATPLTAAALPTVARIGVTLRGLPRGSRQNGTRITPLQDDVFVRLVDPDGSPVPLCA